MKVYSYSNIGKRETQEDSLLSKCVGQQTSLHVVADGMGGYQAGEVAAKTAVSAIYKTISEGGTIQDAAKMASLAIADDKRRLGVSKMGCTIAGVLIKHQLMQIFWAGDSRVYLLRNGKQNLLTEDHSLLNDLSKHRHITPELKRRYGGIVTKAIMGNFEETFDEDCMEIIPNDEILICTDGLYRDCPVNRLIEMIHNDTYEWVQQNDVFSDNHSFIYIKI